ncbi:MAG: hypothetical protein K6F00_08790, partial [Lachnospiraceae bacterium]|nr:hypothetical protein [Lachnospiraceae bacterium]
ISRHFFGSIAHLLCSSGSIWSVHSPGREKDRGDLLTVPADLFDPFFFFFDALPVLTIFSRSGQMLIYNS